MLKFIVIGLVGLLILVLIKLVLEQQVEQLLYQLVLVELEVIHGMVLPVLVVLKLETVLQH